MAKKQNRESVVIGHLATKARPAVRMTGGAALAARFEAETAAAQARADELDRILEGGIYRGSGADPGSIVGLDGLTPSSETPMDGDTDRTDPNPS